MQLDWWQANRDCRWKGMRLLSIESEEEQVAISNALGIVKIIIRCSRI